MLQGTIISFSKVKPISKDSKELVTFCYADQPFVHIKMQAEFLVFKPYKGCLLPATIVYSTSSSISLTVFDYFQASANISEHRESWEFQQDKWYKGSESIANNDVVVVEVEEVTPNNEGVSMLVKIVKRSDVPPQAIEETNEEQE